MRGGNRRCVGLRICELVADLNVQSDGSWNDPQTHGVEVIGIRRLHVDASNVGDTKVLVLAVDLLNTDGSRPTYAVAKRGHLRRGGEAGKDKVIAANRSWNAAVQNGVCDRD